MSYYWAIFTECDQEIFRFDTRIYLDCISVPTERDTCIGAIVGKNPGSAKASNLSLHELQKIALDNDKLLPTVRNVIKKAYEYAGKDCQPRSYIQVLNLFYLCNPNLEQAIASITKYGNSQTCYSESKYFPWIWYVWGGEDGRLTPYKLRFTRVNAGHHFYYDKFAGKITNSVPSPYNFAKHTQGLKHDFVVPHIAKLL